MKQHWFMRKDVLRAEEYTVVLIWFYLFLLVVPSGPTRHFFIPEDKSAVESIRITRQRICLERMWRQDNTIWFTFVVSCQFLSKYFIPWFLVRMHQKEKSHPATFNGFCSMPWRLGLKASEDGSKRSRFCASRCFGPKSHRHIIAESVR